MEFQTSPSIKVLYTVLLTDSHHQNGVSMIAVCQLCKTCTYSN